MLHPFLLHKSIESYRFDFDLRFHPMQPSAWYCFGNRQINDVDFQQLATIPPVHQLRLYHPLLPWYIDIKSSRDNGIQIWDVFFQIHTQLVSL